MKTYYRRRLLDRIGIDSYYRQEIKRLLRLLSLKGLRSYRKALAFHDQFLEEGDLVFDVGANMGSRCSLYLALGARVVAIEPVEECLQMLMRKFRNCRDLTIVPQALGVAEGELPIFVSPEHLTVSSMSPHWIGAVKDSGRFEQLNWTEERSVSVTTLDSLIGRFGEPAFVKIDVEGSELNVLKGLSQMVKYISFEFTPEFLQETEQCIEYLSDMSKNDYQFNYSVGESMEFALVEWVDSAKIIVLIRELPVELFGDIYARPSSITFRA